MDNSTIKEICDVVTEEVMKQVQQHLSAMKPDLIQAITEASAVKATETVRKTVDAQNSNIIRQLQQKNAELEKRISQLEMQKITPTAESTRITAKAVDGINTLSAEQIDDILSFPCLCCEANNWIYYIKTVVKVEKRKKIRCYELYKVRTSGAENQKIFAGKLAVPTISGTHGSTYNANFSIVGDKLYFMDIEGNKRVIKV